MTFRKALVASMVASALGSAQADAAITFPELSVAVHGAQSYWHGDPPCGFPYISFTSLPSNEGGEAFYDSCTIFIALPANSWTGYDLCIIMTHEWGHLVLGPNYFAAVNPSDPAHSPSTNSIMNAGPSIYSLNIPQCRVKTKRTSTTSKIARHRYTWTKAHQ